MFVPYDPSNCHDVYRPNDRCVCGCSAVITCHSGENTGYCNSCSEKRKSFVDAIIGDIYIGKETSLNYTILSVIEGMRKSFCRERFYYMIDCFFASRLYDESFVEPYEDELFIIKMYREKQLMTELILKVLYSASRLTASPLEYTSISSINVGKCVPKAYEDYKDRIIFMKEKELNEIDERVQHYCNPAETK